MEEKKIILQMFGEHYIFLIPNEWNSLSMQYWTCLVFRLVYFFYITSDDLIFVIQIHVAMPIGFYEAIGLYKESEVVESKENLELTRKYISFLYSIFSD